MSSFAAMPRLSACCCALLPRCCAAAARCASATARAPTWPTGGSTATSTSTTSRRRACARRIGRLVRWHRATQLPDYADLLARAQRADARADTTPAQVCRWMRRAAQRAASRASSRRVPAAGRAGADAHAGAARAHRAALREGATTEFRNDYLQADPQRAARGGRQAHRSSAPRCSTAASTRRSASASRRPGARRRSIPSAGWPSASAASSDIAADRCAG